MGLDVLVHIGRLQLSRKEGAGQGGQPCAPAWRSWSISYRDRSEAWGQCQGFPRAACLRGRVGRGGLGPSRPRRKDTAEERAQAQTRWRREPDRHTDSSAETLAPGLTDGSGR